MSSGGLSPIDALVVVKVEVAAVEFESAKLISSIRALREALEAENFSSDEDEEDLDGPPPPLPPRSLTPRSAAPLPHLPSPSAPPPLPPRSPSSPLTEGSDAASPTPRLEASLVQPVDNATHVRVFCSIRAASRELQALRATRAALTPAAAATPRRGANGATAICRAAPWLPLRDLLRSASRVCVAWSAALRPASQLWRTVHPARSVGAERALLWRHVLYARGPLRAYRGTEHRAVYADLVDSLERTRASPPSDEALRAAFRARDATLAKTVSKTLALLTERVAIDDVAALDRLCRSSSSSGGGGRRGGSATAKDDDDGRGLVITAALPSMSALHRVLLVTALSGTPRSGGSIRAQLERCLPQHETMDWSMHGVDFVAALLLRKLPHEADAWRCLSALLDGGADEAQQLRSSFTGVAGLTQVYVRLAEMQYLLALHAPRLEVHLRVTLGAPAHLWGLPFVLSAFADAVALPPSCVDAAWDALITTGWDAVPHVAVALMRRVAPRLLATSTISDFLELWRDPAAMRRALAAPEGAAVEGGASGGGDGSVAVVADALTLLHEGNDVASTDLPTLFAHACSVLSQQVKK